MFWFGRKKQEAIEAKKEAEFRRIHDANIRKNYHAAEQIDKVNKLIENGDMGITELVFLATGGDRRHR